eukprot:SAG11_NODE_5078_length_1671_cov_2.122137_2_plen_210_part_00
MVPAQAPAYGEHSSSVPRCVRLRACDQAREFLCRDTVAAAPACLRNARAAGAVARQSTEGRHDRNRNRSGVSGRIYLSAFTCDVRTARHGTAQHGTARHGTARHSTARHGTAQWRNTRALICFRTKVSLSSKHRGPPAAGFGSWRRSHQRVHEVAAERCAVRFGRQSLCVEYVASLEHAVIVSMRTTSDSQDPPCTVAPSKPYTPTPNA